MKDKRWSRILELCEKQNIVTVEELVQALHVSEATIRRDLCYMEDNGLIARFHGGARMIDAQRTEKSMNMKSLLNVKEKEKISRYGASLIQDGQIVFLDRLHQSEGNYGCDDRDSAFDQAVAAQHQDICFKWFYQAQYRRGYRQGNSESDQQYEL